MSKPRTVLRITLNAKNNKSEINSSFVVNGKSLYVKQCGC